MFDSEEVKVATIEYIKQDNLATNVWMTKYCLKDKQGNYMELTPDDMHRRLAKEFSRIESKSWLVVFLNTSKNRGASRSPRILTSH